MIMSADTREVFADDGTRFRNEKLFFDKHHLSRLFARACLALFDWITRVI